MHRNNLAVACIDNRQGKEVVYLNLVVGKPEGM
jgi:hypothetical protein